MKFNKIAPSIIILKSALDGELRRVEPSLICFGATNMKDAAIRCRIEPLRRR
jgi:hypothetical protein